MKVDKDPIFLCIVGGIQRDLLTRDHLCYDCSFTKERGQKFSLVACMVETRKLWRLVWQSISWEDNLDADFCCFMRSNYMNVTSCHCQCYNHWGLNFPFYCPQQKQGRYLSLKPLESFAWWNQICFEWSPQLP